jgi:hypothetical protein
MGQIQDSAAVDTLERGLLVEFAESVRGAVSRPIRNQEAPVTRPFQPAEGDAEADAGGGERAGAEHGVSLFGDMCGEQVGESCAQAVLDDPVLQKGVTGVDAVVEWFERIVGHAFLHVAW